MSNLTKHRKLGDRVKVASADPRFNGREAKITKGISPEYELDWIVTFGDGTTKAFLESQLEVVS